MPIEVEAILKLLLQQSVHTRPQCGCARPLKQVALDVLRSVVPWCHRDSLANHIALICPNVHVLPSERSSLTQHQPALPLRVVLEDRVQVFSRCVGQQTLNHFQFVSPNSEHFS
eukprot:4492857-Amphidinium_carterae.1